MFFIKFGKFLTTISSNIVSDLLFLSHSLFPTPPLYPSLLLGTPVMPMLIFFMFLCWYFLCSYVDIFDVFDIFDIDIFDIDIFDSLLTLYF